MSAKIKMSSNPGILAKRLAEGPYPITVAEFVDVIQQELEERQAAGESIGQPEVDATLARYLGEYGLE
jgi:hypothetical protein